MSVPLLLGITGGAVVGLLYYIASTLNLILAELRKP